MVISMIKTVLQLLENSVNDFPNKYLFSSIDEKITYIDFLNVSKRLGSYIVNKKIKKSPIVVFLDKSIACLNSMMGVLYSGNFYSVIDVKMPKDRIITIFDTLNPKAIITNKKNLKLLDGINNIDVFLYEDMVNENIEEELLNQIRDNIIDTDPMYVLFTSGSTGIPKGVTINNRALLNYILWFKEEFNIDNSTVFGSQTPFYFSMSVSDIFATMISGATFEIIPKMLFSFPVKLVKYLDEREINTIYWVPSALAMMTNFSVLENYKPKHLKKILFAGEVMPTKQLNILMRNMPDVEYANLFGPTETTDICTFYKIDRNFKDNESIPIGKKCNNCDVIVLNENNELVKDNEIGELCVRGSFLSLGYYNNIEKTKCSFVQNPLNKAYEEKIYRTGDIVKYNEHGELMYLSRKDFQIKHMGNRIELGEIETQINSISEIDSCACIYDQKRKKIVLFYVSKKIDKIEITKMSSDRLINYMVPNVYIKLDSFPYNNNGKIDREKLRMIYEKGCESNE